MIGRRLSQAEAKRLLGKFEWMQEFAAGKFHFEPPSRFTSLDHLVGAGEQRGRDIQTKRSRRLQVDDEAPDGAGAAGAARRRRGGPGIGSPHSNVGQPSQYPSGVVNTAN